MPCNRRRFFHSWLSGPRWLLGPQPGATPSTPTRHLYAAPGVWRRELTTQSGMPSSLGLEGSREPRAVCPFHRLNMSLRR